MELERKILFPAGRYILLILAVFVLLLLAVSVIALSVNMGEILSPPGITRKTEVYVEPRPIKSPITRAEPGGSPIVSSVDPAERLNDRFPDAQPTRIILAGNGVSKNTQVVTLVESYLEEAVIEGDDPKAYVDNAVEYIKAERQMAPWEDSIARYHEERMFQLRRVKEEIAREEREAAQARILALIRFSGAASLIFGCLWILCMLAILLAVLAIERNTRPRIAEA